MSLSPPHPPSYPYNTRTPSNPPQKQTTDSFTCVVYDNLYNIDIREVPLLPREGLFCKEFFPSGSCTVCCIFYALHSRFFENLMYSTNLPYSSLSPLLSIHPCLVSNPLTAVREVCVPICNYCLIYTLTLSLVFLHSPLPCCLPVNLVFP